METSTSIKTLRDNTNNFNTKNYIPTYLKKRINKNIKDKNGDFKSNTGLNIKANKTLNEFQSQNVGDTTTYIQKLPCDIHRNTTYFVYRNELNSEKTISNTLEEESINTYIPSCLPESPDSYSPCSSPNSIGTVRDLSLRNKIEYMNYSTYSEKSSSENYEPENGISKNRKTLRKFKNFKKPNTSTAARENKENISDSSPNSYKEEFLPKEKRGRNKDTIMTEITAGTPPFINLPLSKSKIQEPSTKIIKDTRYSKGTNLVINKSFTVDNIQSKTKSLHKIPSSNEHLVSVNKTVKFYKENIEDFNSIENDMKSLIEENLNNIEIRLTDNNFINIKNPNSVSVDIYEIENVSSLTGQLTTCDENCSNVEKDNYKKLSIEPSNVCLGATDVDLLSIKSTASLTTSKFSEYFSAENEIDEDYFPQMTTNSNNSIIQGAFDYKQNLSNNESTVLLSDAYNESLMHRDPYRDVINYINSVDSEVGSYADVVGHETSDEILSQQSSDNSYESCFIDDDENIPFWLFESDSEPQRVTRVVTRGIPQEPLPIYEPELDLNGNVMEPTVVGAGAGDGKGIHSDLSRETSGGSSISSSDTSSELESQDTFSNLSGTFRELEMEPPQQERPVLDLPNESLDAAASRDFDINTSIRSSTSGRTINNLNPVSDVDADISSLDTDVPDSDN